MYSSKQIFLSEKWLFGIFYLHWFTFVTVFLIVLLFSEWCSDRISADNFPSLSFLSNIFYSASQLFEKFNLQMTRFPNSTQQDQTTHRFTNFQNKIILFIFEELKPQSWPYTSWNSEILKFRRTFSRPLFLLCIRNSWSLKRSSH